MVRFTRAVVALALVGLVACGDDDDATTTPATTESAATAAASTEAPAATEAPSPTEATETPAPTEPTEIRQVTLLLPGLPGAAAGGYVAAAQPEIASKYGLEMEVIAGGQGVFNTIPQVASGQAQFSLSSTANLFSAQAEGVPAVQIFAGYDYPVCLMSHAGQGIEDFPDLEGRTVAVTPGSAYWEFIKARYNLTVNEVGYTGGIGPWAADESLVQQCITLNEPYVAEQEGFEVDLLLVSDSGFNPYQNVLFTTQDVIDEDPELVGAVVAASKEGWETYLENPGPTNDILIEMGSTQTPDQMEFNVTELRDKLFSGEIGFSDPERMQTTYEQLREVNVLTADLDWEAVFTNEFLP